MDYVGLPGFVDCEPCRDMLPAPPVGLAEARHRDEAAMFALQPGLPEITRGLPHIGRDGRFRSRWRREAPSHFE